MASLLNIQEPPRAAPAGFALFALEALEELADAGHASSSRKFSR
jgi:hypothetical protein